MHVTKLLAATSLLAGAALLVSLVSPTAPAAPTEAAPAPAATTYEVDPVHSSIVFRVLHQDTAYVYGRFNEFQGTLSLDTEAPEKSSVEIEINLISVDTNNRGRDDHLRGPDFFDSKQFPSARFASKEVKSLGEDRYSIAGELTLRGKTLPVSLEVEKTGESTHRSGKAMIGFHGELDVDRMAYGVAYGPEGLGHTVKVLISLEAIAAD